MIAQRWKGARFSNPRVTYKDGKRIGKWPCGHRRNVHAKRRGRRRPAVIVHK